MTLRPPLCLLLLLPFVTTACRSETAADAAAEQVEETSFPELVRPVKPSVLHGRPAPRDGAPISEFVRRIFQDSRGDLWFGTNGDGVARLAGETLEYFSLDEGFGGLAVRGILEDDSGDVWFGTSGGVTRYDGQTFKNYTKADGLLSDDVWCLELDRHGVLWIGSLAGVNYFDGDRLESFVLPASQPDPSRGVTSARIVHCIKADRGGRLWFGTNGGAYIWDEESLSRISAQDGLSGDNVNCILEDRRGRVWFATHHRGVCRVAASWPTDIEVTQVTAADGVQGSEVWDLFEDHAGDVWFPVEGFGVYRYEGNQFRNYAASEGMASRAIQCTYQDREGRIWCGGYTGLYRLDGDAFRAIGRSGPWR